MAEEHPDRVVLHQFAPYPRAGVPSMSSFCIKLETFLRAAKIDYVNSFGLTRSSKGKVPWVEWRGESVADSHFVIERLTKDLSVTMDEGLSAYDKAIATMIQRTCEDHLYFVLLHDRWVVNWDDFSAMTFEPVPWMMRSWVASSARSGVDDTLFRHGIGRHDTADIVRSGIQDLEALSAVLGDKPYFLGEKFTSVDCTAFGHLVLVTDMLYGEPFKQAIEANPALHNLKAYVARVKEAYWSDWDDRVAGK